MWRLIDEIGRFRCSAAKYRISVADIKGERAKGDGRCLLAVGAVKRKHLRQSPTGCTGNSVRQRSFAAREAGFQQTRPPQSRSSAAIRRKTKPHGRRRPPTRRAVGERDPADDEGSWIFEERFAVNDLGSSRGRVPDLREIGQALIGPKEFAGSGSVGISHSPC